MSLTSSAPDHRGTSSEQLLLQELEAAGIHVCSECEADLLTLCASEMHRFAAAPLSRTR